MVASRESRRGRISLSLAAKRLSVVAGASRGGTACAPGVGSGSEAWAGSPLSGLACVRAARLADRRHRGGLWCEATALHIHGALHALGPRAGAVLHTHMPAATALASLRADAGGALLLVHQVRTRLNVLG